LNKIKKGIGAAALAGAAALGATHTVQAQQKPSSSLVDPRVVGDTTLGASYHNGMINYQGKDYALQGSTIPRNEVDSATVVKLRSRDLGRQRVQPTTDIALVGNRAYVIE